MANIRKYLFLLLFFIPNRIWAQAYMHEAAEDSDSNPIYGFLGLLLLIGIVYLVKSFAKNKNQIKETAYKEKLYRGFATSAAEESLKKFPNISEFQNHSSWIEGYIDAQYDIQYGRLKKLNNETIDSLISKLTNIQRLSFFSSEAVELMKKIGYFQHLEHNNKLLIKEGKRPFDFVITSTTNKAYNE